VAVGNVTVGPTPQMTLPASAPLRHPAVAEWEQRWAGLRAGVTGQVRPLRGAAEDPPYQPVREGPPRAGGLLAEDPPPSRRRSACGEV